MCGHTKKMNTNNAQEDVFLCGRVFFLPFFPRRGFIEKEERDPGVVSERRLYSS